MIKVVTFDLDGVYFFDYCFRNFKQKLVELSRQPEDTINEIIFKSQNIIDFKKGIISENDYWAWALNQLNIKLPTQDIFSLLGESYVVNPRVHEVLLKLQSIGIKTAICSNNFVTRIREINSRLNFLSHFDIRVFSYEVGAIKPNPIIYHSLISASSCLPSEIAYSDDKPENIKAATSLGINAFPYVDFEDFQSRLRSLGVAL